jgi:hypothetical protein
MKNTRKTENESYRGFVDVPVKFVLEIFHQKSKIDTTIAENALRRNYSNIPCVTFRKMFRKETIIQ